MLEFIDFLVFPLLIISTAYLVFHFRWKASGFAFLLFWLAPYFWGSILSTYDAERNGMLDAIWLMGGWVIAALWIGVLLLVKRVVFKTKTPH